MIKTSETRGNATATATDMNTTAVELITNPFVLFFFFLYSQAVDVVAVLLLLPRVDGIGVDVCVIWTRK